jgi:hypothetical protein
VVDLVAVVAVVVVVAVDVVVKKRTNGNGRQPKADIPLHRLPPVKH